MESDGRAHKINYYEIKLLLIQFRKKGKQKPNQAVNEALDAAEKRRSQTTPSSRLITKIPTVNHVRCARRDILCAILTVSEWEYLRKSSFLDSPHKKRKLRLLNIQLRGRRVCGGREMPNIKGPSRRKKASSTISDFMLRLSLVFLPHQTVVCTPQNVKTENGTERDAQHFRGFFGSREFNFNLLKNT